jgi:uncharacterized protein (TIGR02646 family)
MRRITKQSEPRSLVEHRATTGAEFAGCNTADIRTSLVEEQRGLCCYCCGRIFATHKSMKIEHFVAQSVDPAKALSYSNMLGACLGGMGSPPKMQHCDTKRGNRPIEFNPADPQRDIHPMIILSSDGRITSPNATFSHQLDNTLGLNLSRLMTERERQLKAVGKWWREVHARKRRRPNQDEINLQLERFEPPQGDLVPFQFAAVWWLKNKVAS